MKWATCNVGVEKPEECGDYFAWGEVEPKEEYTWENYKWCDGTENIMIKYNDVDGKITLDSEDDAAVVNWGGSWRMAYHIGLIPAVLISPSDQYLIDEGSDERRRFMDVVISQYDKPYLMSLMRCNQALLSRNALLKQDDMPDAAMLEIYEMQMAVEAEYIYARRKEFIEGFTPVFEQFYGAIAGERERVELHYKSHSEQGDLAPLLAVEEVIVLILG